MSDRLDKAINEIIKKCEKVGITTTEMTKKRCQKMTKGDKFELYLEVEFLEFLDILCEEGELSSEKLQEYVEKIQKNSDDLEVTRELTLNILD